MSINDISKVLYWLARRSRDVNAISRGPEAVAKRAGRIVVGRLIGALLGRIFR